jgi:tRNA(Ile)-lysidine synthase
MLGFWRAEIEDYLKQRSLKPAEDITNLDVTFARNRIRHGLVPYLESYNPEAKKAIWRTAGMLAGDFTVLEQVIDEAYRSSIRRDVPGAVAVSRSCLLDLPRPTARYVLRRAISRLRPGLLDIAFDDIERAFAFLENPPHSGESDLAAGLGLFLEGDLCWMAHSAASLPTGDWPQVSAETLTLPAPGRVELLDGWQIEAAIQVPDEAAFKNSDDNQAWLDSSKLNLPLTIRRRLPGDRFCPAGMQGKSLKLSDLMINERVPRRAREAWPLVCCGTDIVWVPGVRQGIDGLMDRDTQQAVHLTLRQGTLLVSEYEP